MKHLNAGKFRLELGKKTHVMGILNFTPDSFSDGGDYFSAQKAAERAVQIEALGADIIDIGANSTRPGAEILDAKSELARLESVLPAVCGAVNIPVSVDTFYPECAEYALKSGAGIINDVSGTFNTEIAELVKQYDASLVVTHNPCGASEVQDYNGSVVAAVRAFFLECIGRAAQCSLPLEALCLDPGIGFGKSDEDNLEIIRNINWLKINPCALLFAASRKRVTALNRTDPKDRDFSSVSANTAAVAGGADIIRVHNITAGVDCARMADRIYRRNGENNG